MSDAEQTCPVCGLLMTLVQRVDGETSTVFEWQCVNLHMWRQTATTFEPISEFSPVPTVILTYESE